jgi:predicted enzyme related to lactoylglutathione lyase
MAPPAELGYFAIPSLDPPRSRAFWGEVFGWSFAIQDEAGLIDIDSTRLPGGIAPMPGEEVLAWFRVEDIHGTVDHVRVLGGSAPDAAHFPFGWTADCTDNQGVPFSLWQMEPGLFPETRRGNGRTPGEPGYFVLPSPDPEKATTFYGPLFNWRFADAAGNGYRHVENIRLPGGIARMAAPGVQPFFRIEDMGSTIDTIRRLGGAAEEPSSSASGQCCAANDDQGVRFSLWQPAPGL